MDVTPTKDAIAAHLDAARRRTRGLLAPLDERALRTQHSPLMSPLVWDFAHIGNYEELWLLRAAAGGAGVRPDIDDLYDAFRHARRDRTSLPLLGPAEAGRYVDEVRARALDDLDRVRLDGDDPLLSRAFVYGLVVQHEHQHDETMLATMQLMESGASLPLEAPDPTPRPPERAEVLVPAGPFTMGAADDEPWAYDNEHPAHEVDLAAYWIDTTPVTNGAFAEFMADGGYDDPRWWTADGWTWRQEAGATSPLHWVRGVGAGEWLRNRFGMVEPVPADEPVVHVCWHEAAAYARWAGKRLPTEAEWEKAAAWDPQTGRSRRFPWGDEPVDGRANLGQQRWRPSPIGSWPDGVSAVGCHQMLGDVWEWTASAFTAYPGFTMFPYPEYSAVFFGIDYKVLRGGSWASCVPAIRTSFRNWDYPIRRQVFAGFRCARDA